MTFPTRSSWPRIRFIGALIALLALTAWAAADRDGAQAGAGPNTGPVQNFNVDANVCYGSSPGFSVTCPPGSDTAAPASSSAFINSRYVVFCSA